MDVDLPDTTLHCQIHGSGPTILAMHGGLGLDHTYFRPWLDPLAEEARLVYYDHRGNGRSDRPESLEGVDHATWAADADALREYLGEERVVVLGHSYGAFLALEYAIRYPERLRGLVLLGATPALDYIPEAMARAEARATPDQLEALTELLSAPAPDDGAYRTNWLRILPIYFHEYDDRYGREMDRDARYSAAAHNHAFGCCVPEYDVRPYLPQIAAPTLVLSGRHDWITPPELGARRLLESLPNARGVEFEQSGHFPFIEETEGVLEVIREWLAEL